MTAAMPARARGLVRCHTCQLVCEDTHDGSSSATPHCPRCGTPLHVRRPDSIARAWACLLAALMLYLPANLLPVMHTSSFGRSIDSTILQGVVEFWQDGSYGIAGVIFIASVAVPCTKFLILGLLLVTAQRRSNWARRERTRLYRLVELIGYWSMLDVLVVGMMTDLVKFGTLSDVEPRMGILFFGSTVVLTMVSAMCFDPRLIWDGENT